MTEHGHTPPLTRRVPGASGSGPPTPARMVLPAALVARMRAATQAARRVNAAEGDETDEPDEAGDPGASPDPRHAST